MDLKKILIVFASIAAILGVAAIFVVFYNPNISVIPGNTTSSSLFSVMKNNVSSTIKGIGNAFSGNQSSTTATENQSTTAAITQFSNTYAWPYPLQWTEGESTLVITSAAIQENKLTLGVVVHIGNTSECVPANIGLVIDESGNLGTPTPSQFSFPDTNSCNGTANMTYDPQIISFTLDNTITPPLLLTTGGASNIFFEIATTTSGGINISLPATTD